MMSIGEVRQLIQDVPDFPKPGIMFKDITPVLENPVAYKSLTRLLCEQVPSKAKKLVAIESRGFLLASAMSQHLDCGVVLVRKPGKLPRPTWSQTYALEYGEDQLEIHRDALLSNEEVVIVDDVLATGGTAEAVEKLTKKAGGQVLMSLFLMEIEFLSGSKRLKAPARSLIQV
jgi:adenine phosphoribosyltransferase